MPKKPLEKPDGAKFRVETAGIDEKIAQLQETFDQLKADQHETRSSMQDDKHGRNPIQMELKELFSELSQYNRVKKDRLGEIDALNQKI